MTQAPKCIDEPGLSRAWSRVLIDMVDGRVREISPLIVSITGFDGDGNAPEDSMLRTDLDTLLESKKKYDTNSVAFTIFPQEIWELAAPDRQLFYKLAMGAFPDFQELNRRANGRGLYWERLIAYGLGQKYGGNQLEFILDSYLSAQSASRSIRRSLLQAATFDPNRDHNPNPRLHFPCLQQVSFVPSKAGLITNAFYATQQLFYKAYGNFLGLGRLGAFMAGEMNMPLARLNVYVGVEKLEGIPKNDPGLAKVIQRARMCLANAPAR
jgi:hypothetical protein